MLRVWEIEGRKPVYDLLREKSQGPWSSFQDRQTWVISDLRTKFEIQDYFLKSKESYVEDSVLRASDLWKKILFRARPEMTVITPQAAQLHLRHFLREHGRDLELKDSSDPTLLKWMRDLAPVYFHPAGFEKLEEWFQSQPQEAQVWKDWWLRVRAAFAYFESKRLLLPAWIPSYLQSVTNLHQFWTRDLYVDLGGQMTAVEAGLFQQLAQHVVVQIFAPKLQKKSKYLHRLKTYENLLGVAKDHRTVPAQPDSSAVLTSRFASTLGSIRHTTALVRKWIESGVRPSEISIMAPDIEALWPVLKFHLEKEGIPFNKETVIPLQAAGEVQAFLARLRVQTRNLSSRDLELSHFEADQRPDVELEKFQSLFKNLYDEQDYHRHELAKKVLTLPGAPQRLLNSDEFLVQLMAFWNESDVPVWLETLLREVLGSFDSSLKLPWREWVLFCESCLARKEQVQQVGDSQGVFVASLLSAPFSKGRRRIFLEISEETLKSQSRKGLSPVSCRKLAQDLGFWLENADQSAMELELDWTLQETSEEDHLFFSVAQLSGQTQTPASLWLEKAQAEHSVLRRPESTVWDSELLSFSQNPRGERLLQDLGQQEIQRLDSWKESVISPSAVESFLKCPFVYFARQTVGLRTFPEVDLDQNRQERGQVLHKILEEILRRRLEDWNDLALEQYLDGLKPRYFPHLDSHFWPPQRKKFSALVRRFLDFERDWRREFPAKTEHFLEVSWEGTVNGVIVRGRIDRVDRSADGALVVLDYKSSSSDLKGAHEWIEKGQLQMLFYMKALESGWVKDVQGEVVAALYYVVKTFRREIGFELIGDWPGFYRNTTRKKQKMLHEMKLKLLQSFDELVGQTLTRLKQGELTPKPQDEKDCPRCDWRKICRSTHLN